MKKCLYYMSPLVLIPVVVMLCEYLENIGLIAMSPYILVVVLSFVAVVIGNISPSNKRFDCVIALIVPLTFCGMMFIGGFLKEDCSGTPVFSFGDAVETAFQPLSLIICCLMAIITFCATFKPIRIISILNKKD